MNLPQGLANLYIHLIPQALLKGAQNPRPVRQTDADNERKTEALPVAAVKIAEAFVLLVRETVQSQPGLLPGGRVTQLPGPGQLSRQIRMRADQRQFLLVRPGFHRHPHRRGKGGPVLERPLLNHFPRDPFRMLINPSKLRDEAIFLHRIQICCR